MRVTRDLWHLTPDCDLAPGGGPTVSDGLAWLAGTPSSTYPDFDLVNQVPDDDWTAPRTVA